MMPRGTDGGRTALAGFLYQFIGGLALEAQAQVRVDDPKQTEQELDALLDVVIQGRLIFEVIEEDLVITSTANDGATEVALIQYKYSRQSPPAKIGKEDLQDIIKGLENSAKRAKALGHRITHYVLVTNREYGPTAEALRSLAASSAPRVAGLIKGRRAILNALESFDARPQEGWLHDLEEFGRRYGATELEIERGIDQLVGKVFRHVADGADNSVTKELLASAFTETKHAKSIAAGQCTTASAISLEERRGDWGLPLNLLPRAELDRITALTAQRALVILSGGGGSGKTATAWQWAYNLASSTPGGDFTALERAATLKTSWVASTISGWRGLHDLHDHRNEDISDAIARLVSANPSIRPVLHLALDGADEVWPNPDQQGRIETLVRWCDREDRRARAAREKPRVSLIVTCREADEFLSDYLHLNEAEPARPREDWPPTVPLDDFTDGELLRAIAAQASYSSRALAEVLGPPEAESGAKFAGRRKAVLHADPTIIKALHHPLMLGTFLNLSSPEQEVVLQAKAAADTYLLAEKFIERFVFRVRRRHRAAHLTREGIKEALRVIAQHTHTTATDHPHTYEDDWRGPTMGVIDNDHARALWGESLSGGLVTPDARPKWRWRHPFVRDYLASLSAGA
jgi:hypothetical protein